MRFFILVCVVFTLTTVACTKKKEEAPKPTPVASSTSSSEYNAVVGKDLNELKSYKWWLKYETKMLVLRAALDDKDVSADVKKAWIKLEAEKDTGHQRSLCFIEEKGKTYIMEPIYNLDLKEHRDMMAEERAICIKDLPTDMTINDFTKDYYTITGPSLLKEAEKIKLDVKSAPCPFKFEYYLGEWRYLEKNQTPTVDKANQKLLTTIGLSRDCINANIRYYVGELLKKPKK